VGPVHTENFADGEAGVARAKAEVFAGLEPGGIAVLNADNRWFELLKQEAERAGALVRTFGAMEGCDARLTAFEAEPGGARVAAVVDGEVVRFALRQSGQHWGPNALATILMLKALDVDMPTAVGALETFQPLSGRGAERPIRLPGGDALLIDESYNANPISMAAALATVGARAANGRRMAVLTDMLELGPDERALHAALVESVEAAGVDLVFCAGPLMKSLWDALPSTRRGGYALNAADLAPLVERAVEPGDVVMVKGSNGSRAHVVAAALAALGARAGERG
jgi:UDP-N-acetylmuramoyl-tripeptide--D-alanyl-D-alanine ligase